MLKSLTITLCLLLAWMTGCGRPASVEEPTSSPATRQARDHARQWTVMAYMDSDNDLEAYQMEDIGEMLAIGSSPEVQLVVLLDRALDGEEEQDGCTDEALANLKNFHSAKLLSVQEGKLEVLEEWGEVNMAHPATLERFVAVSKEKYPARRYALIIGDHGSGWSGACADDSAPEDDLLTLPEMARCLKGAELEFLGFDCCLMATLEVGLSLVPAARYMISSEELEPGTGWSYTPVLKALHADPALTGEGLGRVVADSFKDSFDRSRDPDMKSSGLAITLSVVDLSRLAGVETMLESLGRGLDAHLKKGGRQAWLEVARARSRAEEYGASSDGEPGESLHDLVDLAGHLALEVPSLAGQARALEQATRQAVVYNVRGKARPQAHGLSLYFPPDQESYDGDYALVPGLNRGWHDFLKRYGGIAAQDTTAPEVTQVDSSQPQLAGGESLELSGEVEADDLDECYFVLAQNVEDEQVIIGSFPTDPDQAGKLAENWDGRWYALGDKDGFLTVPITEVELEEDGSLWAACPAQLQTRKKAKWRDVTVYLYLEKDDEGELVGEVVYAMLDEEGEQARELELRPGNRLRPVFLTIDAEGNEEYVPNEHPDDVLVVDEEGLAVEMLEVDPGSYSIGFMAVDLAGNSSEEMTEVEIEE